MNKKIVFLLIAIFLFLVSFFLVSPKDEKVSPPIVSNSVKLRLQSFALSLHPLKIADVESRQVATLMYAGLISQGHDGMPRPLIASSWSQNGNTWEFTLNPNLTFSNGMPLTAEDVASSLCASMQPSSPWAWSLLSIDHQDRDDGKSRECTGIQVGEQKVLITETNPVPWLFDALSGPAGWILPKEPVKEQAYGVMPGAGPYIIKEIVPDTKVVLKARREGSPVDAGAMTVEFHYLPDDTVAAQMFAEKKLHVLDLTSPQLVDLMLEKGSRTPKFTGTLVEVPWDRVRVVIINEKKLAEKGFSQGQIKAFLNRLSADVDRDKMASLSKGIAVPLKAPFPPAQDVPTATRLKSVNVEGLPPASLSILTESDPYSDLLAANIPKQIGEVTLDYKGVEKGILLNSLFTGDFEAISMLIEATAHSPEFWKSFFTPGNPFSVAGKPLPSLTGADVSTDSGIAKVGQIILEQGNWIPLLQEKRLQLIAPDVSGVTYSPSGQSNFVFIQLK